MTKKYLVIDSDDYQAAGIETFFFPGGEPHVKIPRLPEDVLLFLKLRSWNDVGLAVMLLDAIKRHTDAKVRTKVFIPYFPGARQDRSDQRTPLTVDVMWEILNPDMVFDIYSFDIHSGKIAGLLEDNFMPSDLPNELPHYDGVIVPDEGAIGRAENFANRFVRHGELIYCKKERDFSTGRITGFKMPPLPEPGRYLIVDDICDGGMTFNLLAEAFDRDIHATASRLDLWVSHGIFSKGLDAINRSIERIHTTDSFARYSISAGGNVPNDGSSRVTIHSLAPLFDRIMGV